MPSINVQLGAASVSVERAFQVAPRVGDILHITYGEERCDLLVDFAQHSEDPEDNSMCYFVHAEVIGDLSAELSRQMDRGHS
jgi:hypothetical protein